MTDNAVTPAIPVVRIENETQFADACKTYGVSFKGHGRKPFKALAVAITFGHGHIIDDTEYFNRAMGLTVPTGPRVVKIKPIISWAVTYSRVGKNGKPNKSTTDIVLSEEDIRTNAPNVKGSLNHAFATLVLAALKGEDWTTFYVHTVQKVSTLPAAPTEDESDDEDESDEDMSADVDERELISA